MLITMLSRIDGAAVTALRVAHGSRETDQSKNSNCVFERFDHV
jgi:hypothetical protein